MSEETDASRIIPVRHFPAPLAQAGSLPSLIVNAGETAAEKFICHEALEVGCLRQWAETHPQVVPVPRRASRPHPTPFSS